MKFSTAIIGERASARRGESCEDTGGACAVCDETRARCGPEEYGDIDTNCDICPIEGKVVRSIGKRRRLKTCGYLRDAIAGDTSYAPFTKQDADKAERVLGEIILNLEAQGD